MKLTFRISQFIRYLRANGVSLSFILFIIFCVTQAEARNQPTIESFVKMANELFDRNIRINYSTFHNCSERLTDATLSLCEQGRKAYETGTRPGYMFVVAHEYAHALLQPSDTETYYSEISKFLPSLVSHEDLRNRMNLLAHVNVDMLAAKILAYFHIPNYILEEFEYMKLELPRQYKAMIEQTQNIEEKNRLISEAEIAKSAISSRAHFANLEYGMQALKNYQPVSMYCSWGDEPPIILEYLKRLGIDPSSLKFISIESGIDGLNCIGSEPALVAKAIMQMK